MGKDNQTILKKLEDRIRETAQYENIYTMGMRGLHDEAMKGSTNPKDRARTLEKVFEKQRAILEKYPEATAEQSIQADQNLNGIPDEWERKYNVSARFAAPESDEDGDGFSLIREYRAGTNPVDPLSHPKYITQIYFTAIELVRISWNAVKMLALLDHVLLAL